MHLFKSSSTAKLDLFGRSALFCCLAGLAVAKLGVADPILVSEVVAKQNATAKVVPVLPPIAKQTHLSGRVVVQLSIGEDGSVSDTKVLSGNPILGMAASKAGKGWAFRPFMGPDGKPTLAMVKLTFEFD